MACSEPFEVDRHDLMRQILVYASKVGCTFRFGTESLWHQTPPTVEWLNDSDEVLGTGVYL